MKKILEAVNALILLCMLAITVLQIVFRVILRIPASWSEELAQYTFAALVFVGAATLCKNENHITISMLVDRVSPVAQKTLRIIGRLITVPFLVPFILGAYLNMRSTWTVELPTVGWVHIGYIYLVLFISSILMLYYLAANIILDLIPRKAKTPETGGLP